MYPYADQLLAFQAHDPDRRLSALILEVKGDFCHQVREIAARHGRADDYLEVGLESGLRYNPLHNDLEAYALAYGIASLLNNLFGHSEEPFWQQAYTNLVKFLILLHKVVDGYVTLFDVYASAINPDRIQAKLDEGARQLSRTGHAVLVDEADLEKVPMLQKRFPWSRDGETGRMCTDLTVPLKEELDSLRIHYTPQELAVAVPPVDPVRRDQLEAVRRWYQQDWMRIEPKLRTSIIEGISVFLSLFDDNPAVKYTFCPPKECYDPVANADGQFGIPLPPFADLIESGRIVALNFPVVANPGLARMIGTFLKQDFQRAVLSRIPRMAQTPGRQWREVLFLCDEYHAFATVGEHDPTGDEKFFALSRQARCIPIVATQSLSSLRSTLPGESWRTLFQTFRTKIFLALSDDFSAKVASELCGRAEQLKPTYTIAESGQDARVSMLTGRAAAHRATVSASKTYQLHRDFVFEAKIFTELRNAQAIVLAYDGFNPRPPTLLLPQAVLPRPQPNLLRSSRFGRPRMSFDVILPFLRPIEPLLLDPSVTEIMVNGSGQIFIEREGRLEPVVGVTLKEKSLQVAVRNMARALGDDISEDKPLLDSRLPDGSRVAAVFPPCSLGGTTLTIRKFQSQRLTVSELLRTGTLTPLLLQEIRHALEFRQNVLISGGTGTGKTTVLNALADLRPVRGPDHPDRGHRRTAAREAEPRAVRGPARAARRAAGEHPGPAKGNAPAPARPDHRG